MSLPKTLGETYMLILTNVPDCNKPNTTRILQFLTFSQRPLRIDELVDVIAVDLEHEPSFDIRSRMPVPMEILRYCPSLVAFSEETHEIRLAHFSVKEFITSQEDKGVFTRSLEEIVAHESIIEIIVAYLLSLQDTRRTRYDLKKTYHLASYCAKHWLDHATIVEENSPNARQRLLQLFSNYRSWSVCNMIYNPDGQREILVDELDWPDSHAQPLYIASLSGLKYLVKDLLQQGADIDAVTGRCGTALRVACEMGHSDIARVLIENGADMDIVGGFDFGTALVTAIDYDLTDIACLLINLGADPGIRGGTWAGSYGEGWREIYPLHAACSNGAEKVVKALIDKNVDIDLKDEYFGTPLVVASSSGNEKMVKLLLQQGANINARGYKDTSALHEAVSWHHKHIVQLLLEHGADINARDDDGKTPLWITVAIGDPDGLIPLLLDHGADIHLRDCVEDLTPLEKAELEDDEDAIQLLRAAELAAPPSPSRTQEDTDEFWSEETEDSMSEND